MNAARNSKWFVGVFCVIAVAILAFWLRTDADRNLKLRIPGTDAAPSGEIGGKNPVLTGKLIRGAGHSAALTGTWPQFRGPKRDGIASETDELSHDWKASPPRELWSLDVGEGYAGVAAHAGRVYLLDYDRDANQSALRCLSLADGKELWRFSYPLTIKRNHGMTRTVPTLAGDFLVALDSKCNVFCLDATSGALKWTVSLVNEFGATIPEWYAGQCPLVDGDKVILAPGGKNALLLALDLATGKPLWQSSNPHEWKMTHASIMPMDFGGRRSYVYCASKGVVGVDANTGQQLWETADWKISIATVPSPVPLPDRRIFLTGGYNAGSLMLQTEVTNEQFSVKTLFKLPANVFGATQHTPILKNNRLYGIRADGRFVCLGLDGKVIWSSSSGENFGLGSFLLAGDLIYALNDSGQLSLLEASSTQFSLLGQVKPLTGRESWAPMALADGRLLLRDLTRLVCLDVSTK
jgi:outer membrane protein assembly factor BamB